MHQHCSLSPNDERSKKEAKLYNSRGINIWMKYLESKYAEIDIDSILEYANMQKYQIWDQAEWFTQSQIDLFYEKVVQLTKNKNIAREAGRFAAFTDAGGSMLPFALSLLGPAKVYSLIGKTASNITRSCIYKYEKLSRKKIKITVKPKPGVNEKPYQCENRIGYFEAIALIFKHDIPNVEHHKCMFNNSKYCEYIISWKDSLMNKFKKAIYCFMFLLIGINAFYLFYDFNLALSRIAPVSIFIILFCLYISKVIDNMNLNLILQKIKSTTDEYKASIETNYNNALLINEIGIVLSKQLKVDDILEKVTHLLQKRLDYDRGMIVLANDESTKLMFKAGFGYTNEQKEMLDNTYFNITKTESQAIFVSSFLNQEPYIVNDIDEIKKHITPHSYEFACRMNTRSFICVPIIYENESLGLIVVDNKETKRPLLQSDVNLLMGIAPQIGIGIRNALLIKSKLEQFNSILFTLVASIDARDFLTAGHSEKVMEYSVGICNELGLSEEYAEMIRIAALLHDYGKIGLPDSILKNTGKLTTEEYREIQNHTQKTRQILERINFEGIFKQIPEIAGCHHEKLDGSGYPLGLQGDDIPLGAKIIAVADIFEATTSKRHYRDPMPVHKAIDLLIQEGESGKLDPEIINAFILYYSKLSGVPN